MRADAIRCRNDLELFDALKKHPDVKRVNDMIARHEAEGPSGIRRRLLATSVRLSNTMAKDINTMADECIEKLGVELPLELYVYSSPQFNAACFKPEEDRLFVMFSSSLLEAFDSDELRFVMGHELGHHVYRHHDIPIGYLLRGQHPDPKLALELFAWSRYAEISADRAGAYCAQNIDAVARSLFKLASGLSSKVIKFSLEDFVAQVDEMQIEDAEPGQGAPQEDWFSTHPFSPLRVKALELFERAEMSGNGSMPDSELEVGVQSLMSLMEPSYLEGKTDVGETMRRLLFAGAIAVADASHAISKKEIEVFEQFFGKHAFSEKLNIEKIKQQLPGRISETKQNASQTQCMQVLRDLCLIALADDKVSAPERVVLDEIAVGLGISTSFVSQTLESSQDLD